MARPLYESQRDRTNEQQVADFLSQKFDCTYFKLPIAYSIDYAFLREGKVVGFVEVKCRKVELQTYDTIMLSMHKRVDSLALANSISVPALFAIRYNDGIYTINLEEEPDHATVGGRFDRDDPQDVEVVIHYKTSRLKKWN